MGWPFASVGAPNLDTGPGVDVPTVEDDITALPAWLQGAHFSNPTGGAIAVTLKNTAGDIVVGPLAIPAGAEQPFNWSFRPVTGLKWVADGAGLLGQVWGYE